MKYQNILAKMDKEMKQNLKFILHFFFKAPGDPVLTADMDTCSEALAQLDDVIMHTFQQCVYHLTKVQYKSILNVTVYCFTSWYTR